MFNILLISGNARAAAQHNKVIYTDVFIHYYLWKKEVDNILHYKLIHQQAQESDGLIYLGNVL
jgi:predicted peptidase